MASNNADTIEKGVEKQWKILTAADLKTELIQWYLDHKLQSKESVSFLNEIDAEKDIPEEMKKDLKLRIKSIEKFSSLKDSDIDSLGYLDIISQVTSKITWLRVKRKALKNIFLREYNISSSKYDKDFGKIIAQLDDDWLENLLDVWELERKELLTEIYGKNVPEKKNLTKFINEFNLKARLKKLNSEDRERFEYTISLIQWNNWEVSVSDLEELFDLWIFTKSEQKELVLIFIPTMSLTTARHLGIVTKSEENKIRHQYIDEWIKQYELKKWLFWEGLSWKEIQELKNKIFSDLESKDLLVEVGELSNFDRVLWKLIDAWELEKLLVWFKNVVYKANNAISEIETYDQFENVWKYHIKTKRS